MVPREGPLRQRAFCTLYKAKRGPILPSAPYWAAAIALLGPIEFTSVKLTQIDQVEIIMFLWIEEASVLKKFLFPIQTRLQANPDPVCR